MSVDRNTRSVAINTRRLDSMKRVHAMLCGLLFCVTARADQLNVRIAGKAECLDGAQLRVSPEGGKPLLLKTTPEKNTYSVPLPAAFAATVEVTRDGCWGDRRLWSPGDDAEVELRMYAAATVTGSPRAWDDPRIPVRPLASEPREASP